MRPILTSLLAAAFAALIPTAPANAQEALPAQAQQHAYEVGQIWEYRAENSGEKGALVIQHIDAAEDGPFPFDVYHISMIVDLRIGDMEQLEVGHLPVARETLDASVTTLTDRDMTRFADWNEGYKEWQRAEGGVFDITIAQIIDVLVEMMSQAPAPDHGHSGSH